MNKVCHRRRRRTDFEQVKVSESKAINVSFWQGLQRTLKGHLQRDAKPRNGMSNGNFSHVRSWMAVPRAYSKENPFSIEFILMKTKAVTY